MSGRSQPRATQSLPRNRNDAQPDALQTLIIGDVQRWMAEGRQLPQINGFHFLSYLEVSEDRLRQISPAVILSPLVDDAFDAIDVGRSLSAIGYRGRYRVVTEAVPNPRMVIKEIRSNAPGVDVDLLVLPPAAAND